jgi:DNA-binding NarL/FixJ family response regulator
MSQQSLSPTKRRRIIIADDHILVAEACRKLLEPEYEIAAIVGDGRALVTTALRERPDLALVDIGMPVLNGLDAGRQIKEAMPSIKVVYLTMNSDIKLVAEAFRRKASGYVLKTCAASELLVALRTVLEGGTYLSPALSKDDVASLLRERKEAMEEGVRLTERQREVLQLLSEGKTNREVATILNVATRTVAFHKYRLMEILKLRTTGDLIRYAARHLLMPY